MKKILYFKIFFALAALAMSAGANAQTPVTSVSYFCGFEDAAENANWTLGARTNGSAFSKWAIGSATACSGANSMYVSKDNGVTAEYADSVAGYVIAAFREFALPAGTYDLSFDWKCVGEGTENDAFRVGWVKSTDKPTNMTEATASTGSVFPVYVLNNSVPGSGAFLGSGSWKTFTTTITIPAGSTENFRLFFVWKANGSTAYNPGACIDNVNIAKKDNPGSCFEAPTNLQTSVVGTSFQATWTGNAQQYEVQYYAYNSTNVYTDYITANSYSFPANTLPEGVYTFRVRSICGSDTSIFITKNNFLIYYTTAHCLDFITLTDANCWIGTVAQVDNAYQQHKVVDFGYSSYTEDGGPAGNTPSMGDLRTSRQTVHYIPGETDPNVPLLKTKPDGAIASVRVGNANVGSYAEAVEYKYNVPAQNPGLLTLKYAAVIQNPSHGGNGSRVTFEILDVNGYRLSSCTAADFSYSVNMSGWNTYTTSTSNYGVWKDWSTIGVNLTPYAGQTITIRVTNRDCDAGGHYAYCYFTLDCSSGILKSTGTGCHESKRYDVAEGFAYKWYQKYDPNKATISDTNYYVVPPSDTATYCVDMISLLNPSCYFTLETEVNYYLKKYSATICAGSSYSDNNYSNLIYTGIYTNVFRAVNGCDSIVELTLTLAPPKVSYYSAQICSDGSYTDEHFTNLTKTGNYRDTIQTALGCDSIVQLNLTVNPLHVFYYSARICSGGSYTDEHFTNLTKTGNYRDTIQTALGCDSIVELNLTLTPPKASYYSATICAGSSYSDNNFTNLTYAGNYIIKFQAVNGCDSIVELNLTLTHPKVSYYSATICAGSSYSDNNFSNLTQSGNYTKIFKAVNGCDSTVQFNLKVNTLHVSYYSAQICSGGSYTDEHFTNLTQAGNYRDTLKTAFGCDSIVELNLTLTPPNVSYYTAQICTGGYYTDEHFTNLTQAGNYRDTIQTAFGCDSIVELNLTYKTTPQQNICMVSVDANNHNQIVWQRAEAVASYNVYREGNVSGQYDLLANVPYSNTNIYTDMASNAAVRSYRYKVSATNVCGLTSMLSTPHRTIHLTISQGQANNVWNLNWDEYEGVNYSTYNIYRAKGNNGAFELINTMSAGNKSYTDLTPPSGNVYYMLEIVLDNPCNISAQSVPSYLRGVTDETVTSIRSNIVTNAPTATDDLEVGNLKIYPNPVKDELGIKNDELRIKNVEIVDLSGRAVLMGEFNSPLQNGNPVGAYCIRPNETTINVSSLPQGIYFIKIQTDKGIITREFVKE